MKERIEEKKRLIQEREEAEKAELERLQREIEEARIREEEEKNKTLEQLATESAPLENGDLRLVTELMSVREDEEVAEID